MKKFTTYASLMAAALMVSCAQDPDVAPEKNQSTAAGGAYVTLKIASPTGTRADLDDQAGTQEESTVNAVRVLLFDKEYNYIGYGKSSTPKEGTTTTYELEVAPNAYRFFAIVNPTEAMDLVIDKMSGGWNTVEASLQTILTLDARGDVDTYSTDNAFTMVSAGSYADNLETVLVRPIDAELINGKISTVKSDPTAISIKVDRMVAKFTANVSDKLVVEDKRTEDGVVQNPAPFASIDGVRLNVVNKKSYIYSHINQVNSVGDDYRADPNMSVGNPAAEPAGVDTDLTSNFFWLHNYESPAFNTPGEQSTEYVFENTATGDYFNYNNLTQLVVKATYIPTGQPDPDNLPDNYTTALTHEDEDKGSWFAINIKGFATMQMTFNGVKSYYKGALEGVEGEYDKDLETCEKMNIQLRHMLSFVPADKLNGITDISTVTWADDKVTCEMLNSIPNGGYVAATVDKEENYIVQFYQFGLNYYDIFIQHDSEQPVANLGRWGMVRNNHYTLTVNSITGPGLPYIPDPTDPEIKDPQNPDPKDPEPADKGMAYIDATIDVNPWTMWTQDVDLN